MRRIARLLSLWRLILSNHSSIDNPELPRHRPQPNSADQGLDAKPDFAEHRGLRETDHHDAAVRRGVEEKGIAKIQIECDEATLLALSDCDQSAISSPAQRFL